MGVAVRAVALSGVEAGTVSQNIEGSKPLLRVLRGGGMFANGILILHSLL